MQLKRGNGLVPIRGEGSIYGAFISCERKSLFIRYLEKILAEEASAIVISNYVQCNVFYSFI